MSKNIRYSITVDVPEGVNPVSFKSKIESLYDGMSESPADEERQFKNCFKVFYGSPCFVEDGTVTAALIGDYVDWNGGAAIFSVPDIPDADTLCSDENRMRFLQALSKSGLEFYSKKRSSGEPSIRSKFHRGDYVCFGPYCWGCVEGRHDGMVSVYWYYNPKSDKFSSTFHLVNDATYAYVLTNEEKQSLIDKMELQGYRVVNDRLDKVGFRAKKGREFYTVGINYVGHVIVTERIEDEGKICSVLYNSGNYFQYMDEALEAAKRVEKALFDFRNEKK